MTSDKLDVLVIDMQPITPAIGGGRQRLLGLYHALGEGIAATYVGSYDWPGEAPRDHQLTPGLREIVIPLSDAHHAAAREAAEGFYGRVVIDCLFSRQGQLSPEYMAAVRQHIPAADVVVFSHPWAYPLFAQDLSANQLIVYDSQNVEAVLRTDLHGDVEGSEAILNVVVEDEYALCRAADLILTCSHDDRETFAKLYDLPMGKLRVVPNGIFALGDDVRTETTTLAAKDELGLSGRSLAVFVGSNYGPNNDAARFIATDLAFSLPDVVFGLIGGCVGPLQGLNLPDNVKLLGILDEADKQRWLRAADVALNPLRQGSGTSIKMFDFMAAGVPVLTTAPGARGIVHTGNPAYRLSSRKHTARVLRGLLENEAERRELAARGRRLVEDFYAWERISPRLGRVLRAFRKAKHSGRPLFSVIVPSYERPDHLDRLFACLSAQKERDFEVICIDQSKIAWAGAQKDWGFPLTYVHTAVRGAVKARNAAGELAVGEILAFTDDDCEPRPDWLSHARLILATPGVVGIEGKVESDHANDEHWRPVTNVAFVGLGFMTANLLVRNDVFQALDGFDLSFDEPHFREDTEFGWRMQEVGGVPYGEDVRVFHPAHRRDHERESSAERARFFEKDALLYKKHPDRYMRLFLAEGHWHSTPGFWEHFERGAEKYSVDITEIVSQYREMHADLEEAR